MASASTPLTTRELINRTFSLYRNYFGLFVGIFALAGVLALAFEIVSAPFRVKWFVWLPVILINLVAGAASQAAAIFAVSQVQLNRPAGVIGSFANVMKQLPGVIGLGLILIVLLGLGFIALVVPGVLMLLRWAVAIPAKVLENRSIGDAMSRSSALTKDDRGRIFVILLVFSVLSFVLNMLLQWPLNLGAGVNIMWNLHVAVGWLMAALVVSFISTSLVSPFLAIALTLLYYDERVRKEAISLQPASLSSLELQHEYGKLRT